MAYVGTPIDTRNQFQSLQGKRFNGDGSTTDFTLDVAPSSTLDIEVFVGNVRQDPNSAYTVSGTTLSFTGAPPSGTNNIYVVHQAKSVGTIDPPATETVAKTFSGAVTHSSTTLVDTLGVNSAKDLGTGIHIKTADSGASVSANADELVIEGSANSGLSILSGTSSNGRIMFGDSGDNDIGYIEYDHGANQLALGANAGSHLKITSDGRGLSQFSAKAWCTADGTGTPSITDSHNISSLTDHETGQLGMNFANNMTNSNYTVIVNAWHGYAYTFGGMDMSTSTFKATCSNGSSYVDVNRVHGLVFGD